MIDSDNSYKECYSHEEVRKIKHQYWIEGEAAAYRAAIFDNLEYRFGKIPQLVAEYITGSIPTFEYRRYLQAAYRAKTLDDFIGYIQKYDPGFEPYGKSLLEVQAENWSKEDLRKIMAMIDDFEKS